ncbi:hypothetical protein [Nostoc sp.]|uniref:hypothetical protein n=1 Tax=Nostoc sp. TaxID=1180 RepID=UPI002FF9CEB2
MPNTVSKYSDHDIESLEALKAIRATLSPRELSDIEEVIFLYTWNGKLYREMSQKTGYEQGYLKDIGSVFLKNWDAKLLKKTLN